ncbi:MAG: hypothetical protein ABIJ97_13770, partial [Bacteroidota bacterium]
EAMNVFSIENMKNPLVLEYNALNQKIAESTKNRDKKNYIDYQCKLHELEFKLFPERHGPKSKQKSFQKKYMDYYNMYYNEVVDDKYFDKFTNPHKSEAVSRLKYTVENGVVHYEFNEDFIEFIDENIKIMKSGFENVKDLKSIYHHPENSVVENPELMYQISVNAFLQAFSKDIAEKIVEHIGLKHEYIEIPDVTFSEISCKVCQAKLSVPENSTAILCEQCGCVNQVKTNDIKCHNCGADFDPTVKPECPYCKSVVETHKSTGDLLSEKYREASQPKQKSGGGIWSSLFGKKK